VWLYNPTFREKLGLETFVHFTQEAREARGRVEEEKLGEEKILEQKWSLGIDCGRLEVRELVILGISDYLNLSD